MITFFSSGEHRYTIRWYLDEWAPLDLARRMAVYSYDEAERLPAVRGTYVFGDLERLSPEELALAGRLYQRLQECGEEVRLLNDPSRALRRHELLDVLHERGINPFRAHRLSELCRPDDQPDALPAGMARVSFPVFLREERHHNGTMTSLLHDWPQVHAAAHDLTSDPRWSWDGLLAVEFCDTADDAGVYASYGAFVIGGRVAARHLSFAREWQEKGPQVSDERYAAAALAYVQENPHGELLAPIAALAHIDYGRFDYAMVDGQPRVWEINTNPTIMVPSADWQVYSRDMDLVALRRIAAELRGLDVD